MDRDLAAARDFRAGRRRARRFGRAYMERGRVTEVEWNMVHYDVQLIGGVLHCTGARWRRCRRVRERHWWRPLPMFLNALTGRGVHLVTVNDYLARRDAEWMGPHVSVPRPDGGLHRHVTSPTPKRAARRTSATSWSTGPTTSLASTTCGTTWPCGQTSWSRASTTTPSWTRWTAC